MYYLPFATPGNAARGGGRRGTLLACLVLAGILLWLRTYHFIWGEWQSFTSLNRAQSRVAKIYRATHYDDDIEPLVENIQGKELVVPRSFDGVYLWNLSGSQSMWIVSKRAWLTMKFLAVSGDGEAIGKSDALREVFDIQEVTAWSARLVPRRDVTFRSHPYWGSYLLLWVNGDLVGVNSTVNTHFKK